MLATTRSSNPAGGGIAMRMHFRKSGYPSNILHTLRLSKILHAHSKNLRTPGYYPLPSKFLRTPSEILRTPSKILRTTSKNLRIPSKIIRTPTPTHTQVGLPLYLANMFKAMKASSPELQAQLEKMVHPTGFPKFSPPKRSSGSTCSPWTCEPCMPHYCFHGATENLCEKWDETCRTLSELRDSGVQCAHCCL